MKKTENFYRINYECLYEYNTFILRLLFGNTIIRQFMYCKTFTDNGYENINNELLLKILSKEDDKYYKTKEVEIFRIEEISNLDSHVLFEINKNDYFTI